MSIAIVERLGRKIPLDENNKNDISYQQEPNNIYGESTDNFTQYRDPNGSLKENSNFSSNNLVETDKGYDFSGDYNKTTPNDGGFVGYSGRGSMSKMYLYPEFQLKEDPSHKLTYREKHSYDFERLKKYDSKQLKQPRFKPCENKGSFSMSSKEIAIQNLKSHINGYKAINQGPHGPFYNKSYSDYVPNLKKNTDEKPRQYEYTHFVEHGYTSKYGRHGDQMGNNYIHKLNRRGRDDKVDTKVLNGETTYGTSRLYGDGRYSGYSGFSVK